MNVRLGWLMIVALLSTAQCGADTVTLTAAAPGGASYQVEGTILDYRGDAIVVERPGGSQKSYPASRVRNVQTNWPSEYTAAKRSMTKQAWAAAAVELNTAARAEQRVWARRQILTDLMRCQMAVGRWEQAGELMIALHASDPATPAWSVAPLPWFAAEYVRPAIAERWLSDPQSSAARLLGASWLLTSPKRDEALLTLQSLAKSDSPIIASLAIGQSWRASLLRVTTNQADAWRQQIDTMPENLRSGPRHVLAQAYYRLARYDAAALAALEGPLAGRASRELAARGLLLAGRAVHKAGRTDEAQRLWSEVRNDYTDTPPHADALALLKAATEP